MRVATLFLACLVFVGRLGAAESQGATEAPGGPDDRLLQAELLEISAGDLPKALEAYRALVTDETAPARVRARALLCLGRCQRKLGQLAAARKTLEELVETYPDERDTLRQARSFLEEIRTGKATNPDFDWIARLEKSPEIQSRVFELAMDLVDARSEAGQRAARQLVALGTIALPVIDRLIETSRDEEHRRRLALIALRAGRLERLKLLLESGGAVRFYSQRGSTLVGEDWLADFLETVPSLPESERERILEIVAKTTPSAEGAPYASALRLLASDETGDIPSLLRDVEESWGLHSLITDSLLASRPECAGEMAARILDGDASLSIRGSYLWALQEQAPERLEKQHWLAFVGSVSPERSDAERAFRVLAKEGQFDLLAELAPRHARTAQKLFARAWLEDGQQSGAPGGWAQVLRAVARIEDSRGRWTDQGARLLHDLAEVNDAAVGEWALFLRNRSEEAPEYQGRGGRRDHPGWTPSEAYAAAMAGLLDVSDPVTLAIALEALALAPPGVGPDIIDAVAQILAEPPDPLLREYALYSILKRLPGRPGTGPAVARLFVEDHARYHDLALQEASEGSPLLRVIGLGHIREMTVTSTTISTGGRSSRVQVLATGPRKWILGWLLNVAGSEGLLELLASTLSLPPIEGWVAFLKSWYPRVPKRDAQQVLLRHLGTADTSEKRAALAALVVALRDLQPPFDRELTFLAKEPAGVTFLEAAIGDPEVPVLQRMRLLTLLPGAEGMAWVDWPAFVAREGAALAAEGWPDDPMKDKLSRYLEELSREKAERICEAFLESPGESLRVWAVDHYPAGSPKLPEVLEQALDDPSDQVQGLALLRTVDISRRRAGDPAPLLKLLEHPRGKTWSQVYDALRELADPRALPPLVELLDDPRVEVRKGALETLNSIRKTLEQRQEWKDIIDEIREEPVESRSRQP